MSRQADSTNIAEHVAKVAKAGNVLCTRASILGRRVNGGRVDGPYVAVAASWVAEDEDSEHFGFEC